MTEQGVNTRNQQERGKSSDITNEERKGDRNGWDSSKGVEVFGRRRDRHAVGSDERVYEQEKIPTEWRDGVIIPIYKEKGDIHDCGNYRGIKLMSHTMKIWERIIDRRLREETTIGDEQFGFMPCRGTTDAIFGVQQLMEKHRRKQKEMHIIFVGYL